MENRAGVRCPIQGGVHNEFANRMDVPSFTNKLEKFANEIFSHGQKGLVFEIQLFLGGSSPLTPTVAAALVEKNKKYSFE